VSMSIRRFRGREGLVLALGIWSLAAWGVLRFIPPGEGRLSGGDAAAAAGIMAEAIAAVRSCRETAGPAIERSSDPNRTGLIGVEDSPVTTSSGQIEAKRTTTNPYFAAALVSLLREAGAGPGDTVAVAASSSFPGLILATLAASKALGVRPLLIVSLGASNWGANDPRWTWLEIADCLGRSGVLEARPLAVSVGGEGDEGRDMPGEGRALLEAKIGASGIPLIAESDLASGVAARLRLFEAAADEARLKAFVNVGGSWVNMGVDSDILKLQPGVNRTISLPPPDRRGLIQEMSGRGIPVVHLLYVKGLAEKFGLPWDPVPLPVPGERPGGSTPARPAALAVYFAGLILAWIQSRRLASR